MALNIEQFSDAVVALEEAKYNLKQAIERLGLYVDDSAMLAEYSSILSDIELKTGSDLSASGANVIIPAGMYIDDVQASVSTAAQATPSISVSSAGLITASATQSAGYVASGTKSSTKQLTTKSAATITPKSYQQTAVATGVYTTGAVKVAGDSNLVASNIKKGVSIFGVTGTYEAASYYGTAQMTGSACNSEGYFYISLSAPLVSGKHYLLSPFQEVHNADIKEVPDNDSDGLGTFTNYFVLQPSSGSSVTVRMTSDLDDDKYYDMYYNGSLSFTEVTP